MTPEEIRKLMELKGWSQAEFARQAHVSESAISRWLSGESVPTALARVLLRQWLDDARAGKKLAAASA